MSFSNILGAIISFLSFSLLPTLPHPFTDEVCSPFFNRPIHRTCLHYHPVKSLFSPRFPIPFCLLASSVTSGCIFKSNYQELEHTNKRKQVAAVFLGPDYLAQYSIFATPPIYLKTSWFRSSLQLIRVPLYIPTAVTDLKALSLETGFIVWEGAMLKGRSNW